MISLPEPWSEETAGRWTAETQGTLVFCRLRETALRWHRRCPQLDMAFSPLGDRRAYSTIVCGVPAGGITAPYSRIILADGDLTGGDRLLFEGQEGRGFLTAPNNEALCRWLSGTVPSLDDMRGTYAALRGRPPFRSLQHLAQELDQGCGKVFLSLSVLRRLGLIEWTGQPFLAAVSGLRRADPSQDPAYRLLTGWKGE